jgi:hypothetical protein
MAWENVVKKQMQLTAVFANKAMSRWLNANTQAKANNYDPKQFASDVVNTWADMFDIWWAPWSYGAPLLPILYITNSAGVVELDHDVTAANVSFTACGQLGGTNVIPARTTTTTSNIQFQIADGRNIVVTGINTVPSVSALYEGLVLEGLTPVARVLVQL